MSADRNPPDSRTELEAHFQELLLEAYERGVNVEGGFECRNGDGHPDWDVIVAEVQKPS